MRRTVRTTVLASTAAFAAAVGAVAMAPIASAQDEDPGPVPFGSSQLQSPDLVVSLEAVCAPPAEDEPLVAALRIAVENVGPEAASTVSTNYGVAPDLTGMMPEDVIDPGETVTYTIPSGVTAWNNNIAGAAVFSPQLDVNYPDNFAVEMLSVDCTPEPEDDEDAGE